MTGDEFDPERLGRPVDDSKFAVMRNALAKPQLPVRTKGEAFLGGPIPMSWVERAAALPGRAWQMACALWFQALCSKPKCPTVQLERRTLTRFSLLAGPTRRRALNALERAGLIRVEYRAGRRPIVTILPAPSGPPCNGIATV
jgi:hypothetical protein